MCKELGLKKFQKEMWPENIALKIKELNDLKDVLMFFGGDMN
jgi:hypothetical protein